MKGLWFFGLGWLVCANWHQFGFEKVTAAPLRINVLIPHAVFTAKLMKHYWISALLKLQLKNTENKSPSALFISTTVSSLYNTKLRAPSATKKKAVFNLVPAWLLCIAQRSLVFTMCYDSSIRWLQNWDFLSLPHMCLLGVILCNACKEWMLFSSKLEILRRAAQCHRRINFLQPFTWALPDLPFKFCEKQGLGNLSKTGSMTLRSMSINNNPFRIHEFQQKATLDTLRNRVFMKAGVSIQTEFHTFLSNLCMQKPMGIQSVREEWQGRADGELWESLIFGRFTIK